MNNEEAKVVSWWVFHNNDVYGIKTPMDVEGYVIWAITNLLACDVYLDLQYEEYKRVITADSFSVWRLVFTLEKLQTLHSNAVVDSGYKDANCGYTEKIKAIKAAIKETRQAL